MVDAGVHVHCLEHDGDALWICAEHLMDGFSVGAWPDGAAGIEPRMRFDEAVGLLTCDATAEAACANVWEGWQFWKASATDAGAPPLAVEDAGTAPGGDAGEVAADDDDGGCRMRGARSTGATGAPFALASLVWWTRRRRRTAALRRSTSRA